MSGMHIMPVYFNNVKTGRKKTKKVNPEKYKLRWREHNKWLKMSHSPVITLEEYIDYLQGRVKVKQVKSSSNKTLGQVTRTPVSPRIPSAGDGIGNAFKKEQPRYNGNLVIGQAYNKGGMQVLSKQESNDPMTGKRR